MSADSTTRATFVMHKSSRDLLKVLAGRYGVTQSEIMNTAPYLFIVMAERSLARRRSQMGTIKLLLEQASRSLSSLPFHLVTGDVEEQFELAVQLEEQSIKRRQVHGPSEANIFEMTQRGFLPASDPLEDTIISALNDVGVKASAARYRAMLKGTGDEGETFIDEDEEAERAAFLEKILGENPVEEWPLELPEKSSRHVDGRTPTGRDGWCITFGTEEILAHTGGDALVKTLTRLVSADHSRLEKIAKVRGRTRPLIAQKVEDLYPNRPDLSEFSREFISGWFVGTNYSRRDIARLLRAAIEACGLQWGVDAYAQ